jgi:hypothetical protein
MVNRGGLLSASEGLLLMVVVVMATELRKLSPPSTSPGDTGMVRAGRGEMLSYMVLWLEKGGGGGGEGSWRW